VEFLVLQIAGCFCW